MRPLYTCLCILSLFKFITATSISSSEASTTTLFSQPSEMREQMSFMVYTITLLGVLMVIATKNLQPFRSRNIWITYISALLPLLIVRLIFNQTLKDTSIIIQTVALTCLGYAQIGYITQVFDYKNRIEREKTLTPILNTLSTNRDIDDNQGRSIEDRNFFSTCMAAILTAVCYILTGRAAIYLFTHINIFSSNPANIAKGYMEVWDIGISLWAVILSSQIVIGIYYRKVLQEAKFLKEYCTLVGGNTLVFMAIIGILIYEKTNSLDQFTDMSVNDLSCILIGGLIAMENIIVCWIPSFYAIFVHKRKSIVTKAVRDVASSIEKDQEMMNKMQELAQSELESDSLLLWKLVVTLKENAANKNDAGKRIARFVFDKYVTKQWNTIESYGMSREFFPIKKPSDLLDTARLDSLSEVVKERVVLPMVARVLNK